MSRYAILTDIHANRPALEAVVEDIRRVNANEEVLYEPWFLGDIVGYGPNPIECIQWLRYKSHIGERWVPGNHDAWLLHPEGVNGEALVTLSHHKELLFHGQHADVGAWFRGELSRALGEAPATDDEEAPNTEPRSLICKEAAGRMLLFVHGSLFHTRRRVYLYPWEKMTLEGEFGRIRDQVEPGANAILFCGHAHYPLFAHQPPGESMARQSIRYFKPLPIQPGLTIINPGSVGQPRDGDTRAAYALFDADAGTIQFRRVPYEVETTIEALRKTDYPHDVRDKLIERLRTADSESSDFQQFEQVYRRPEWDLEAVNSPSPGKLPKGLLDEE